MAHHVTKEFLQVSKEGKLMFESDLYELSKTFGRPVLEFKGALVNTLGVERLSWQIDSSIHGDLRNPRSRDLLYTTVAANWDDGLCQAM